jgi:hypothetical protein
MSSASYGFFISPLELLDSFQAATIPTEMMQMIV